MPLDTRIALSGQPLQVQFRDPIASYNQLAQLTSADTQNQLAQMQMQENRQMAPYRMQEAQSKAASSKLTYDRAVEAQGFIQKVMTEAAQRSNGTAPTNPFEAAKQMLMHPNPDVQTVGQHLLASWQKVQEYEDEMGYRNRDKNAAAAGAAPTAPVNATAAPMVAPGATAIPAPNFASGTDTSGRPVFYIDAVPVSESEFNDAKNKLAVAVAPAANAEPVVNAMVGKVAAKTADDVYAEIMAGDKAYGSSKSWAKERALLEKEYEQALKPGRNDGQRYISLGAGAALDTTSGKIIAKDKIPVAAATPKIINIKGVPHTLNEEGNLEPVPIEGGALPVVAGKAVSPPKITNIKGVPYTINLETGRLEPVPIEGGALPAAVAAQPQSAPKIINIKGVPHIFNVDKGKLERVPVEGGSPIVAKGGAGKAATGGGAKPKAPSGYRYDVSGENLEPIPGGPADKTKEGPAKEGAATEGERKAATLLQRLQFSESQLTEALVQDPNAAKPGVFASAVAKLSTPLANSLTPEARQRVQSAQLDILDAALTLGTGAAYTREQLEGYREAYFPQIFDKPNQIKDKQARLNNVISAAKIAAGKAAKLVPPPPDAAGGSSAMSAADAILNKGRR